MAVDYCRNFLGCNIHIRDCSRNCRLLNKSCWDCADTFPEGDITRCQHNRKNIGISDMPCGRYPGSEE